MTDKEIICLDCDKLFYDHRERSVREKEPVRCPVCGSANTEAVSERLQEFLEENFGGIA